MCINVVNTYVYLVSLERYSDFKRIKRVDVFLLLVVIVVIMGSKAC